VGRGRGERLNRGEKVRVKERGDEWEEDGVGWEGGEGVKGGVGQMEDGRGEKAKRRERRGRR